MNQPNEDVPPDCQQESVERDRGSTWKLPLLLGIAVLVLALVAIARQRLPPPQIAPTRGGRGVTSAERAVSLRIIYGNGAEKRFSSLPWVRGMTVAQALDLAAKRPPGLSYAQQGNGPGALLTRIDQQNNGGPGENSRNWIYRINGNLADKSFAAYGLKPGDVILWTFSNYE
ncbi:MAG: DUF4430 domain-containing protein [Pirellulales bacterium]